VARKDKKPAARRGQEEEEWSSEDENPQQPKYRPKTPVKEAPKPVAQVVAPDPPK
jgi:hypothetical protein